jgi:hypothetical protein
MATNKVLDSGIAYILLCAWSSKALCQQDFHLGRQMRSSMNP